MSDNRVTGATVRATNPFVGRPKMPIWLPLEASMLEKPDGLSRICRIRKLIVSDIDLSTFEQTSGTDKESLRSPALTPESPELFDLPIYNEYFILGRGGKVQPEGSTITETTTTSPPSSGNNLGGLVGSY